MVATLRSNKVMVNRPMVVGIRRRATVAAMVAAILSRVTGVVMGSSLREGPVVWGLVAGPLWG